MRQLRLTTRIGAELRMEVVDALIDFLAKENTRL